MTDWYEDASLPAFEHPPVVETAMGIEFAPMPGMDLFRLTKLQSRWEDRYPVQEEMVGAPPTPPVSDGSVMFEVNFGQAPRRIWASNPDSGLLVQTQADRLILNWRSAFSAAPYPGYKALRAEFEKLWGAMRAFASESGLDEPVPTLAEFTYVNSVPLAPGEALSDVVALIAESPAELPGTDHFARFQFIRDIAQSEEHRFAAQIHLQGEPQTDETGRNLVFTVTTRTLVGSDINESIPAVDAAHALSSHSFAGVVTSGKQEVWGRIR